MIETLFLVRCSGPCGLGLAMNLGRWEADEMPDVFNTRGEAEQAAQAAGWIRCVDHAGCGCIVPVCPTCREADDA